MTDACKLFRTNEQKILAKEENGVKGEKWKKLKSQKSLVYTF